ncbi:MAG: anaerobic ribonucleoside-triphosphate reductase activating protein [Thermoprotei archaeon]|nr:MAG: anaerobic ribonucleoside-triphosphate reductase activating protein [Thermoprotei archaeon]RLE87207.1 MAG: anaerobic ribonucleoside-triphosphate reductase activating protein [Thermoprotei archaeon]
MKYLVIAGYIPDSLVDVIGCITFTVWFSYCNFQCPWCQNSHVIKGVNARRVSIEEIVNDVLRVREFIDYLHVTGGEPTLQEEALYSLFKLSKSKFIKNSLDTNASNPEIVSKLIEDGLIDHIALDVKAPLDDEVKYAEVIGLSCDKVKRLNVLDRIRTTLKLALEHIPSVEIRIPVVPTLHNRSTVLRTAKQISKFIKEHASESTEVKVVLQQFVPSETVLSSIFRNIKRTDLDLLRSLALSIVSTTHLDRVYIRSIEEGVSTIVR